VLAHAAPTQSNNERDSSDSKDLTLAIVVSFLSKLLQTHSPDTFNTNKTSASNWSSCSETVDR
jgi:hypothetical protein